MEQLVFIQNGVISVHTEWSN